MLRLIRLFYQRHVLHVIKNCQLINLARDGIGPVNLMHTGSTADMVNAGNVLVNVKLNGGLCTQII